MKLTKLAIGHPLSLQAARCRKQLHERVHLRLTSCLCAPSCCNVQELLVVCPTSAVRPKVTGKELKPGGLPVLKLYTALMATLGSPHLDAYQTLLCMSATHACMPDRHFHLHPSHRLLVNLHYCLASLCLPFMCSLLNERFILRDSATHGASGTGLAEGHCGDCHKALTLVEH